MMGGADGPTDPGPLWAHDAEAASRSEDDAAAAWAEDAATAFSSEGAAAAFASEGAAEAFATEAPPPQRPPEGRRRGHAGRPEAAPRA